MMHCIVIEDEEPAQRILKKYITTTENLFLKKTFSNVIAAKDYLRQEKIDLIFLDIHLPKITGIEFLKSLNHHSKIIITTAFSEYAIEGYEYNVVDYLLKPFSYGRFSKAISKLTLNHSSKHDLLNQTNNILFIKSGYDLIKINYQEVLYIKADRDYTDIITLNKTYTSKDSLKHWTETLDTTFTQIHKSYIVNTFLVQKISGNRLYLSNNETLPIGRTFKKGFVEKYLNLNEFNKN